MTPRQQALTLARERIETGQDRFICRALGHVAASHPHLADVCDAIGREIKAGLCNNAESSSLAHWVLEQMRDLTDERYPQPYYTAWDENTPLATQMRLAWLDRMLEDAKC